MKLIDTRDKLDEARIFLRYLDQAQYDKPANIPFKYCLSAFLNATYGVREYLKAEFIGALRQQAPTHGKKLSKDEALKRYVQLLERWIGNLPPEKRALWDSMLRNRISETHKKRVNTVTKPKAVSIGPFLRYPYGTERSFAFAAHYVMQQQVAANYPGMANWIKGPGLSSATGMWTEIQEHHSEIGGVFQSMAKGCTDYVALLDDLISHFEQSAP